MVPKDTIDFTLLRKEQKPLYEPVIPKFNIDSPKPLHDSAAVLSDMREKQNYNSQFLVPIALAETKLGDMSIHLEQAKMDAMHSFDPIERDRARNFVLKYDTLKNKKYHLQAQLK